MLKNPIGVEIPTFSWQFELSKQPINQTAWEIHIASEKSFLLKGKADVWMSGKVASDKMFDIIPENIEFKDAQTYWWRVRVWDGSKVSSWSEPNSFTMGLLSKDSWKAKWITADWKRGHRLPYFRNEFKVKDDIEKAVVFFQVWDQEIFILMEVLQIQREYLILLRPIMNIMPCMEHTM